MAARMNATLAVTTRSMLPSSRRPKRATAPSCAASTPWQGGCSGDERQRRHFLFMRRLRLVRPARDPFLLDCPQGWPLLELGRAGRAADDWRLRVLEQHQGHALAARRRTFGAVTEDA